MQNDEHMRRMRLACRLQTAARAAERRVTKMETEGQKSAFDGFDSVRLLAAFQVLSLEDGALGAKHDDARHWVLKLTGREYKPRAPMPAAGADLRTWLDWHESEG